MDVEARQIQSLAATSRPHENRFVVILVYEPGTLHSRKHTTMGTAPSHSSTCTWKQIGESYGLYASKGAKERLEEPVEYLCDFDS